MRTKDARRSVSASGAQVVRPRVPCGSTVAGRPVVSEATRAPVPAAWMGPTPATSVAQRSAASVAMCRLWEGAVPR
jgi:hypothetical protein